MILGAANASAEHRPRLGASSVIANSASAALLVFVDCLKELPATLLLRPLNTETLATLVYGHAARGAFEDGSLAALVIVVVGIIPVIKLTGSAESRLNRPSPSAPSRSSS